MTTLPDLEPAGLTYGLKLIAEAIEEHFGDRNDAYRYEMGDTTIHDVWDAYDALAARSIPEAGKAVDETAQDIIASTYIDGRNEPIGNLHALAILTHLEAAGYRVLASVPAPSGAEPPTQCNCLLSGGNIRCKDCPASGAEPVAWRWHWKEASEDDGWTYSDTEPSGKLKVVEPLYAAPQAVPAEDVGNG